MVAARRRRAVLGHNGQGFLHVEQETVAHLGVDVWLWFAFSCMLLSCV
jgi:hypothetical protein